MKPDGGTTRSGTTGRSPRDRNIRSVEASSEPSLLDGEFCQPVTVDRIVANLNRDCIMCCGVDHDAYCCPLLKCDVESQKKTFSSVGQRPRAYAVCAVTAVDDDVMDNDALDDSADLIDLNDDLDPGSNQNFR